MLTYSLLSFSTIPLKNKFPIIPATSSFTIISFVSFSSFTLFIKDTQFSLPVPKKFSCQISIFETKTIKTIFI